MVGEKEKKRGGGEIFCFPLHKDSSTVGGGECVGGWVVESGKGGGHAWAGTMIKALFRLY